MDFSTEKISQKRGRKARTVSEITKRDGKKPRHGQINIKNEKKRKDQWASRNRTSVEQSSLILSQTDVFPRTITRTRRKTRICLKNQQKLEINATQVKNEKRRT